MPEVAIPLAVLAIAGGGATAQRLRHSLPTVIAFSGGTDPGRPHRGPGSS